MSIKIGDTIPDCHIPATSGLVFNPSACLGKNLVLYFYPKDATPGCTIEAGNFRDLIEKFTDANTLIIGVSRDSLKSHESFRTKYDLPFELISDENETLCTIFDVIKNKSMYGKIVKGIERSTFVFDSKGILRHEWRGLKVAGHVEEVLATVLAMS
jgi:thioredoxin-dependent peroxiredoxin